MDTFRINNKEYNKIRKYKDIYTFYLQRIKVNYGADKEAIISEICQKFYISPRQAKHIIRVMLKSEL